MRNANVKMSVISSKGGDVGSYASDIYGIDLVDELGRPFFTVYLDELVMAFRQRAIENGHDDSTLDDRCKNYLEWMQRSISEVAERQMYFGTMA